MTSTGAARQDEDEHHSTVTGMRDELDALLRDPDAVARLLRLAERHARVARGSSVARDLVWDVIGDALLDPTDAYERGLLPSLLRAVRRRARRLQFRGHSQRDASRMATVSLEDVPGEIADDPRDAGDPTDCDRIDPSDIVFRIRALARDDAAVLRLLALHERGAVTQRVALAAGMTEWAYRTARERLLEYGRRARSATATMAPDVDPPATADTRTRRRP